MEAATAPSAGQLISLKKSQIRVKFVASLNY